MLFNITFKLINVRILLEIRDGNILKFHDN